MKIKTSDFTSQCQVLSFPWATRRKKAKTEETYTQILTFPPPVFTPAVNEDSFPLIQMMNGTDPVVWESGGQKIGAINRSAGLTSQDSWMNDMNGIHQGGMGKNGGKNKIPRPKNAFILYRSYVSQLLKGTMALKVRESNISSLVSEMWKKESKVVHSYFAKRAALEWVQYMKRLQQDRCKQGLEEFHRQKSPTPPSDDALEANGSSGTEGTTTLSSPLLTPLDDTFFSFGSPKTMEPAMDETSRPFLPSPQSPHENQNLLNPDCMLGVHPTSDPFPGYTITHKTSPEIPFSTIIPPSSCSFKDSSMMTNLLNMDYGYSMPPFPAFSMSPYIMGNDLGLDSNLRWPEWVPAPAVWPVQMT